MGILGHTMKAVRLEKLSFMNGLTGSRGRGKPGEKHLDRTKDVTGGQMTAHQLLSTMREPQQ